jgi:hypothetical protein
MRDPRAHPKDRCVGMLISIVPALSYCWANQPSLGGLRPRSSILPHKAHKNAIWRISALFLWL